MSFNVPSFRLQAKSPQPGSPVQPQLPDGAALPAGAPPSSGSTDVPLRDENRLTQPSVNAKSAFTLPGLGDLLDSLLHRHPAEPAPKATPKPEPVQAPRDGQEPATRIIAEQPYSQDKHSAIQKRYRAEAKRQEKRVKLAPGFMLGSFRSDNGDTRRIREIAASSATEKAIAAKGFKKTHDGWQGPAIQNPNAASGRFDPQTYQPHWVFDSKEDSFPIQPDFDGNRSVDNDLEAYQHGVVGGKQGLTGAFTVTQKGEYTVQTYSMNYADNKYTNYHEGDSSTVSIYLKKNAQGKLEPAYLFTSIHFAGNLARWEDVQKDAQGHPIIRVERGSHALHPYGHGEKVPKDGLQVAGDGQASLNGQALPNRLTWLAAQENVDNARYLKPSEAANRPVWDQYFGGYPERREPFHPSLFKK